MKTTEVYIPGEMAFVLQTPKGEHKMYPPGLQQVDNDHVEQLKAKIREVHPDAVLPDGAAVLEASQPDTIESLRERLRQMEAAASQENQTQSGQQGTATGNDDDSNSGPASSLITESLWEKLRGAGLPDAEAVKTASDQTLLSIPGIGPKVLAAIREVIK